MNICVYGASSKTIDAKFTEEGYRLGIALAKRGHGLIFGGGDNGMMGAVARGAHDGGAHIIGIAPSFFNVDGILYPFTDDFIYTDTMRQRKQKMEDLSGAFIVSPGGIGTFEEFFEILTLKQLAQTDKPLIILNTAGYYDALLSMLRYACDTDFMTESTLDLIHITDSIDEALDYIEKYSAQTIDVKKMRNLS